MVKMLQKSFANVTTPEGFDMAHGHTVMTGTHILLMRVKTQKTSDAYRDPCG